MVALINAQNNQRYPQRRPVTPQGQQQEALLPQSLEAEYGVLGSLIIDPDALLSVSSFLKADDFYRDAHRTLYEVILALKENNTPADFITICEVLEKSNKLEEVGGASYITSLINMVPTSGNAEYYGRIVEKTAILRKLIEAAGKQAAMAYDANDAQDVLAESMKLLNDIASRMIGTQGITKVADCVHDYISKIGVLAQARQDGKEVTVGLKTGYDVLDNDIFKTGLKKKNLIIIAARPGIGKSTSALQIALYTARNITTDPVTGVTHKLRVAIFSLEMSKDEIINSLLAQLSGIDSQRLESGDIYPDEWDYLIAAEDVLSEIELYFDDSRGLNCQDIEARLLKLWQEINGIDLVIVDYLQLVRTQTKKNSGNRVLDVGEIARDFKDLAGKLDIPIICACQLNRDLEKRGNKEPQLSDLRESGDIEAAADIVIGLHREDRYDADTERQGIVDVIVLKHRKGKEGRAELRANYPHARFDAIDVVEGSIA